MKNDVNRQVRLRARPDGIPQAEHFELVEAPLPAPAEPNKILPGRSLANAIKPFNVFTPSDGLTTITPVEKPTCVTALKSLIGSYAALACNTALMANEAVTISKV